MGPFQADSPWGLQRAKSQVTSLKDQVAYSMLGIYEQVTSFLGLLNRKERQLGSAQISAHQVRANIPFDQEACRLSCAAPQVSPLAIMGPQRLVFYMFCLFGLSERGLDI